MNFDDTPQEAAFRAEARAWIDANAPKHLHAQLAAAGYGQSPLGSGDALAESKAWQKKKRDAGWACLHWPKEFGGRGASPIERVIWQQEEGVYSKLAGVFMIGQGMIAPTLMAFAEERHKQRYLPSMASGEEIWCQLFSEPVAGSDLAGLRTKAEKDGDHWVVNGQKIWTSGAHYSQYGMILTRTDPNVVKHDGLTMFFFDMKSPGVEVRPIKQVNGQSGFNEVYFTNVRIPDHQRLGTVGQGWRVSLTTLMNERQSIGGTIPPKGSGTIAHLMKEWADAPEWKKDPSTKDEVMKLWIRAESLRLTNIRANQNRKKGDPGPEGSISKMAGANLNKDIYEVLMNLMGADALLYGSYEMVRPEHAMEFATPQKAFLRSRANSIEGGTTEIMKNILGEQMLGLPGEPRVDKDLPWSKVPRS